MSDHKIPLTELEVSGLKAHGLPVGRPSQLSDAFRHGMKWVASELTAAQAEIEALRARVAELESSLAVLEGRRLVYGVGDERAIID